MTLLEIAFHRNGICGAPFYVARVMDSDGTVKLVTMFVSSDDAESLAECNCAVVDLGIAQETIAFGVNSFRGDHYAPFMLAAIREYEAKQADRIAAMAAGA